MSREQGLPKRGRGAPYIYGDLTAKADMGGRQPHASVSGRIPIVNNEAPAPPRRPLHSFMGMRPTVIAASRRREILCKTRIVKKATA
jgi:hypothetical protein